MLGEHSDRRRAHRHRDAGDGRLRPARGTAAGDDRLRTIPFIVISGVDEMDSIVACIKLGAEDYLPKPFDPVLLHARLGACLDRKRMTDELPRVEHCASPSGSTRRCAEVERLNHAPALRHAAAGRGHRRRAARRSSPATGARSRCCSATCAASRRSAETAEPEEVMAVLREFHHAVGPMIFEHQRHDRPVHGRRDARVLQRSRAARRSGVERGAARDRDARLHRRAVAAMAAARPRARHSASASPSASPPAGRSGSRAAPSTPRSAPS